MTEQKLKSTFAIGETVAVEFKRCGNSIESDTYETVCSFLNRFGGDLFLGVEDDGTVRGIPEASISDLVKNFIKMIRNPDIINPTAYLTPEVIKYEGKCIIHIHIPPSSEVHTYKKVIYDRIDDSDVKVTATSQIAQMYIRKQKIYTERKVYPYFSDEHIRFDMFPLIRKRAVLREPGHPWKDLSDKEIMQSAGLIDKDWETGKRGYNLAAIMLLGRDEIIKHVCPTHRTDALLRKVNIDRYDDRLIVETNLIESYDLLMGFAEKHLWNKFFLEDGISMDLRSIISREMLVNTLMHREFSSSFISKFIIEKDRMYTENANRAEQSGKLMLKNFQPNPKNPIIASFLRNIGMADELGSGMRRLHKYVLKYSGKPPELIDGDVFRIIVPLDDEYSFDANMFNGHVNDTVKDTVNVGVNETQQKILTLLLENPHVTAQQLSEKIGITKRRIESNIKTLRDLKLLEREGSDKTGYWIVKHNVSVK